MGRTPTVVAGLLIGAGVEWARRRRRALLAYGGDRPRANRWRSLGIPPGGAAVVYEQDEHPAVAAARKAGATAVWIDEHPSRDAPPHALLSWDERRGRAEGSRGGDRRGRA